MPKHFKNYKKIFIVIVVVLIFILLVYFFMPISFETSNKEPIDIKIVKEIDGTSKYYELNEQECSNFVKILEKSKFYRGVSRPERIFSDKYVGVLVLGGMSPTISIYYDTDKTYVFAYVSKGIFFNMKCRISNKEEIKDYIEHLVNTKSSKFKK